MRYYYSIVDRSEYYTDSVRTRSKMREFVREGKSEGRPLPGNGTTQTNNNNIKKCLLRLLCSRLPYISVHTCLCVHPFSLTIQSQASVLSTPCPQSVSKILITSKLSRNQALIIQQWAARRQLFFVNCYYIASSYRFIFYL